MQEKILQPVKEDAEDFEKLERIILILFRDEIYLPLAKELKMRLVTNEKLDPVIEAIRSDRIRFENGRFVGKFSAAISKRLRELDGKFQNGAFKINLSKLPMSIRQEISASLTRFQEVAKRIDYKITKILPEEIADKLKIEKFFDTVLFKTDSKIKDNLKNIVVSPQLSDQARASISREYEKNLQKYIQEWTSKEVVTLRKKVQERILSGGRYESMIELIQERYQVSESKAKFLARQETGLLMAKFQENRYKDAGINEYIWKCVVGSPLHPVRPMHKKLDGKKFSWDNPPVTDAKGSRNNPGEDYNCRCFARPIVKF